MTNHVRSLDRRRAAGWLSRVHPVTVLALAGLLAVTAYSLATLTRFPVLYGDESWIGSTAWSFVAGHGYRPSIAVGGGVYDHGALDYWLPRLGTAPFVAADLIAGPSFWALRFTAFLIGVAAIVIFVLALRTRHGLPVAMTAGLALAATWGFLGSSHYVRWDSLAFAVACALLYVLIRGTPTRRTALLLGLLFGLLPDIEAAILAAVPAALLLLMWERRDRFARLGMLAGGMVGGAVLYVILHAFPFGRDDGQYAAVYAPAYRIPLREVLHQRSLDAIWGEKLRYHFMKIAYPADRLGFYTLMLGLAASVVVVAALRWRRKYPQHLVPGLLLASHLGGLALIEPNKAPIHAWYALPYAYGAMTEALVVLTSPLLRAAPSARVWLPAGFLAALALVQFQRVRDVVRLTPKEPIFSAAFRAEAAGAVKPSDSIVGDYIYWWGFKDVNYHWNSWIWNYRWSHRTPLAPAFNRLCPDVVLYDDVWNSRYPQAASFGRRFPSMAPTDPAEQGQLRRLLVREYRLERNDVIDGRRIEFWRRKPGACDGILTNGGGTA